MKALAWFIWHRIGQHLQENEEAVAALTKHFLVPLMGKKKPPEAAPETPTVSNGEAGLGSNRP